MARHKKFDQHAYLRRQLARTLKREKEAAKRKEENDKRVQSMWWNQ